MKKLFFVLTAAVILAGCTAEKTAAPAANADNGGAIKSAAPAAEALKSRAPKADELGKDVVCPVMGTKFKVNKTTQVFDYKGKAYYMCCNGCPQAFSKNPEKYIKG